MESQRVDGNRIMQKQSGIENYQFELFIYCFKLNSPACNNIAGVVLYRAVDPPPN